MKLVHITGSPARTLLDRFFASLRLCVFAFDREGAKTQRREGCGPALSGVPPVLREAFSPNQPAPGNAGRASRLAVEHPWPGVPEPDR